MAFLKGFSGVPATFFRESPQRVWGVSALCPWWFRESVFGVLQSVSGDFCCVFPRGYPHEVSDVLDFRCFCNHFSGFHMAVAGCSRFGTRGLGEESWDLKKVAGFQSEFPGVFKLFGRESVQKKKGLQSLPLQAPLLGGEGEGGGVIEWCNRKCDLKMLNSFSGGAMNSGNSRRKSDEKE